MGHANRQQKRVRTSYFRQPGAARADASTERRPQADRSDVFITRPRFAAFAHPLGSKLALADSEPPATAAAAQMRTDICPEGSGLQIVVNKDVIQSIQAPGLDGQHRGAHSRLDHRHGLDTR